MRTLLGILILTAAVWPQDADDQLVGTLGDRLVLKRTIMHDRGSVVSGSRLVALPGEVEVLAERVDSGRERSEFELVVAVYDSVGSYRIPDFWVYLHDGTTVIDSQRVPGAQIRIESVLTAADSTFRGIKDIHRIRKPVNPWLLVCWPGSCWPWWPSASCCAAMPGDRNPGWPNTTRHRKRPMCGPCGSCASFSARD